MRSSSWNIHASLHNFAKEKRTAQSIRSRQYRVYAKYIKYSEYICHKTYQPAGDCPSSEQIPVNLQETVRPLFSLFRDVCPKIMGKDLQSTVTSVML